MMLGGSPVHRVWIITSTSEMSGNAWRGMRRRAQIPASTSRSVPMKTRKRFRAHQSIHREITLHPSFGVHRELFGAEHLPAATHDDADLPGSPGLEDTIPLVNAFALVIDRKSTRLNSSHVRISYAVFCLKKKKKHIVP